MMKITKLPVYGIEVVTLTLSEKYGISAIAQSSGTITCDPILYELCPKCGQKDCLYQCDGSQQDKVQTEDEVTGRIQNNAAVDAILSVILAHACAGENVESPAYLEGIETAFDAIANNIGGGG